MKAHPAKRCADCPSDDAEINPDERAVAIYHNCPSESIAVRRPGRYHLIIRTRQASLCDVLKLNKSFIDGHTGTRRDSVVVSNVAKMANELDMSVITEGVEKEEQVEFLKSVNIDLVQGYLFDKPLPKAAFEQRLKNKVYE
jgi:hypothetical protein